MRKIESFTCNVRDVKGRNCNFIFSPEYYSLGVSSVGDGDWGWSGTGVWAATSREGQSLILPEVGGGYSLVSSAPVQ